MTDLLAQYREMHGQGHFKGLSLRPHLNAITRLILNHRSESVLDYGCGKAELYTALALSQKWGVSITLYDPAVPEFSRRPIGTFDGVICTDVLEHLPESEADTTLDDILAFAQQWAFFSICIRAARKNLPDGRNVHLTVRPQEWWGVRVAEAKLRRGRSLEVQVSYTN